MAYNMTGVEDAQNLYELFVAFNTMTDNLLLYGTLITLWVVLFMVLLRRNPPAESVLSASVVCSVVSLMLFATGIGTITVQFLIGFVAMSVIAGISLYTSR